MKQEIPNSFIYQYSREIDYKNNPIKSDINNILLKIGDKYYLFSSDTLDFSQEQIKSIYEKGQIYINIRGNKVSHDFLNDYRKIKIIGDYFVIDNKNYFLDSEKKIRKILGSIFVGDCLDIGCGYSLYKDIFTGKGVNYLGIDINEVNNDLNTREISFEDFDSNTRFDTIFFFRSINHFKYTKEIISKAYSYLKKGGILFIVENELFGELKFRKQVFEGKKGDFEHYYNYSLEDFKKVVKSFNFYLLKEEEVNKNKANQWYICLKKI